MTEARLTHHRELETWMNPPRTGESRITYRYSDYREVSGLMIPFRLEYFSRGEKTGENLIQRIEIDRDVADEVFDVATYVTEKQ